MIFSRVKKTIACVLTVLLCFTTMFTGDFVFGEEVTGETEPTVQADEVQDVEATDEEELTAEEPESIEILAEDPEQYAEESANSWRYDNGQLTEELLDFNAQMGATIEEDTLMVSASEVTDYGNSATKKWVFKAGYANNKTLTCSGGYLKGIDISVWQGNVDWSKIKTQVTKGDLDFVIIRCGYGTNTTSKDDSKFARNVKACEEKDIPYGVYLYSYAKSESNATSEAKHALRLLKGHYPDYPVYYDLEDNSIPKSKSKVTKYAKIFCSTLANNGYKAGIYANLNWFNNYVDGSALKKAGYDLWLAQWPRGNKKYSSYGYGDKYSIWQCGSYGSVSGISGRVDTNLQVVSHDKMEKYMSNTALPSTLTVKAPDKTEGFVGVSTLSSRFGPGPGFKTSSSYTFGMVVTITGMANGYYQLEDGNWVSTSSIYGENDPFEAVQETDEEGVVHNYIKTFGGEIITSKWITLNGKNYYATETGDLQTGYIKIGNYNYGFSDEGVMYKSASHWFGCKKYAFDSKGRAYLKKAKTKKKTPYRKGPGTNYGKKGTLKKGKSFYVIRKSGSWSQMSNGYWIKTSRTKTTVIYPIYKPETVTEYKAKLTAKYTSRSGPTTSYLKKKTYKKGTTVTVKGTYGNWAQLSSGYWVPISKLLEN